MASQLFPLFKRRLQKRGYKRDDGLLESDVDLDTVISEQHSNGFDLTSRTNQVDFNSANYSESSLSRYLYDSTTQIALLESTETTTRVVIPALRKKSFAFLGIIFAMLSSLMFSVGSLMVKLSTSVPSLEVVFMRLTFQLVFSLPAMIFLRDKFIHPWKKTGFLVLRGITGVTAMSLMVYSVKHMPLADARVIFYTSPVYTALLGRIFLKESVTKFDVIATMLSLGGVVLIAKPTFLFRSLGERSSTKQVWFPATMAIVGAIFTACSTVLIRKISQEVGTRVVVFYFSVVGSVVSLCASLISGGFKYPDCGTHDIYYIIALGFLGYLGQLLTTKALELEKAAVVSLVRTVGIALSFILQLIFLDVVPTGLSIGGALLVMLCNVVIFIKKYLDQKKLNKDVQEQDTQHEVQVQH